MAATIELLRRLHQGSIPFVLIGGSAAIAHGSSVVTQDVDVVVPMSDELSRRIIVLLSDLRPRWVMRPDLPVITPDSGNLTSLRNMYLNTDAGRLDVLGELPKVCSYQELASRSVEMHIGSVPCRVIDIDTLIAAKRIAGRERDIRAIRDLEAIQKMRREQPGLFDDPGKQ